MLDPSALHGIVPPVVTPLTPDGDIDDRSLTSACRFLLASGVHGIWAAGTTGEFACFTADEREGIVQTCVEAAGGRVPVVANAGDCSTRLALDHARRALGAGVDALALTPPYYYLNSQEELKAHFRAVRSAVDLPLLVYNIPQTVKAEMDVGTVLSLAEEGTVVGMKDSQNDLDWDRTLVAGLRERNVPFRLFVGTRSLIDAGILLGGCGAIPGPSNAAPAWCVATYEAAAEGDYAEARRRQERLLTVGPLLGLASGGSAQANAIGSIKLALKVMGVIEHATLAAPLRSPSAEDEQRVAEFVQAIGLPVPVAA
ncbi:MAG: dihydrodipicolinate synthase family protein [Dehalococcoidia bacterium]|nr:dihydrodipicolinate synthase family protein [Dehalococcoidia bacterium]